MTCHLKHILIEKTPRTPDAPYPHLHRNDRPQQRGKRGAGERESHRDVDSAYFGRQTVEHVHQQTLVRQYHGRTYGIVKVNVTGFRPFPQNLGREFGLCRARRYSGGCYVRITVYTDRFKIGRHRKTPHQSTQRTECRIVGTYTSVSVADVRRRCVPEKVSYSKMPHPVENQYLHGAGVVEANKDIFHTGEHGVVGSEILQCLAVLTSGGGVALLLKPAHKCLIYLRQNSP